MSATSYTSMGGITHELHPSRPHRSVLDEDGDVDEFVLECETHNGPECTRCGSWCAHCEPARFSAPCEGNDDMGENGDGKSDRKKNNRKRGGFALVEMNGDNTLTMLNDNLAGQKECKAALLKLVEGGDVKADGQRTFGIIQVKEQNMVPRMKPAKVTL